MIVGRRMRIIEDIHMTEPGEPIVVSRTWGERLLTRPWRPWHSTKILIPQVPRKETFINHAEGLVIMHPEMAHELRRKLLGEPKQPAP